MNALSHRNRYVLRRESGHPGYGNIIVLATADDLNQLASAIQKGAASGRRVDRYVTEERKPSSLGSIGFQAITEVELADLQSRTLRRRVAGWLYAMLLLAVSCLAVYGGVSLVQHFVTGSR